MANALNTVNSNGIEDGSIVNADIKSDAAIALSKLASTPAVLTGSTNNTITTVTSGNNIQGEANLTFDGSSVTIGGSTPVLKTNDGSSRTLELRGGSTSHNPGLVSTYASNLYLGSNGTESVHIGTEHLTITNGDLVIGTGGHGIDFSAQTTSSNSGVTPDTSTGAETLDHYETGTWTPQFGGGLTATAYGYETGTYTRIGRLVYWTIILKATAGHNQSATDRINVTGFPFTSYQSGVAVAGGGHPVYQDGFYNSNNFGGLQLVNTTTLGLYIASTGAYLTGTAVNAGKEIRMIGTYQTT